MSRPSQLVALSALTLTFALPAAVGAAPIYAIGQGPDPAQRAEVKLFAPPATSAGPAVLPYGATYGANVAFGEVDGDGLDELLTGPGPGYSLGPHVRGWSETGTPMGRIAFFAYATLNYGVNVSGNDLAATTSGLRDEIVTGAGRGPVFGPHVRGFTFNGTTVAPMPGVSFFAWSGLKYGADVTDGDLDGDGFDEILATPGPETGLGAVRIFKYDAGHMRLIGDLSTGTPVNVTALQLDQDAADELITAEALGLSGGHVRGFDSNGTAIARVNFYPFACSTCGANVAGGNLDTDGFDELIVTTWGGPSSTMPTTVVGFNVDFSTVAPIPGLNFTAYSAGQYGTNPAVSDTGW